MKSAITAISSRTSRAAAAWGTGLVKNYAASEIPQLKENQSKIVA
jgi:hypothetical protein